MRYADKFYAERSDFLNVSVLDDVHLRHIYLALRQLMFYKRDRKRRAVYRYIAALRQQMRYSSNMVLMSVSDQYALYFFYISLDKRKIRHYQIYARRVVNRRKSRAAIDNYYIIAELQCRHIFPYLAYSAQKCDFKLFVLSCHNLSFKYKYAVLGEIISQIKLFNIII